MAITRQGFEIMLASSPVHENLTAEIFFDGKFIALIQQESGLGVFEIEFPGSELVQSQICRKVNLERFLRTVKEACIKLNNK